jgi:hypothetical protein
MELPPLLLLRSEHRRREAASRWGKHRLLIHTWIRIFLLASEFWWDVSGTCVSLSPSSESSPVKVYD